MYGLNDPAAGIIPQRIGARSATARRVQIEPEHGSLAGHKRVTLATDIKV